MINETKQRIEAYKAALPGLKERIVAVALMLAMSVAMMTSATYAWITLSRSPEVEGMATNVTSNGSLEIALVNPNGDLPAESAVGDSAATTGQSLVDANLTWGNMVNLSDASYGLQAISLRPALLSGFGRGTTPLQGATYSEDGRLISTSDRYRYVTYTQNSNGQTYFAATTTKNPAYGVRGIASLMTYNISAKGEAEKLQTLIEDDFQILQDSYKALINGTTYVTPEGVNPKVSCMDALTMLIEIYVNETATNMGNNDIAADYSSVVTYTYGVMEKFHDVMDAEGKVLVDIANLQVFNDADNGVTTTAYFKDIDAIINNDKNAAASEDLLTLAELGVSLPTLSGYLSDLAELESAMSSLKPWAEAFDPNGGTFDDAGVKGYKDSSGTWNYTVPWKVMAGPVGKLVDIPSAIFKEGTYSSTISMLGRGSDGSLDLNEASKVLDLIDNGVTKDVIITKGVLKNTEQRIGDFLKQENVDVTIVVNAKITITLGIIPLSYNFDNVEVNARISTDAAGTFTLAQQAYEESTSEFVNTDGGEIIGKDTYGMAIDMWVRSNAVDSYLILEGNLKTEEVPAVCKDKNGEDAPLYTMSYTTSSGTNRYDVYYLMETDSNTNTVKNWYYKDSHTLIGSDEALTADVPVTYTLESGDVLQVYTMTYTVGEESTESDVYFLLETDDDGNEVKKWYSVDSNTLIGNDADLTEENGYTFEAQYTESNYSFKQQTVEVVNGFTGENRIWEDWDDITEDFDDGLIETNFSTQGSGSCYTFYAANESDKTRVLNMLNAFRIAFLDKDGEVLATAALDTEHPYAVNGKVTVPVELITGTEFTDENDKTQYAITSLVQNEATWITAIIYLDGSKMNNMDVLAVGEIEGNLNLQYGSSVALSNMKIEDLINKYQEYEASASATVEDKQVTSSSAETAITLQYGAEAHQITVTVTPNGDQPKTLSGFFIRSISDSQASKGETVAFEPNGDGTWTAVFDLSKPGTYSFRSVTADGVQYELDPGNYPTVIIEGMGIKSAYTDLARGTTMTSESFIDAPVTVLIDAEETLMPSQVRAQFWSEDGQIVNATLKNDGDGYWTGTARFNSSGAYTLKYVVMDGEDNLLDEAMQTTHVLIMGITAQVTTTYPELEFLYKGGNYEFPMRVKLFDNASHELTALDDVWLYYQIEGSGLDVEGMLGEAVWNANAGCYEVLFRLPSPGVFVFDRVTISEHTVSKGTSIIEKASTSPTFTVTSPDPPKYLNGNATSEYQFVADPETSATMAVDIQYADTAVVYALMVDQDGNEEMVLGTRDKLTAGDRVYRFTFTVPDNANKTQDGLWTIKALALSGVYIPGATEDEAGDNYPANVDAPTVDNYNTSGDYYVFDLTEDYTEVTTKVVETVLVSFTDAEGNVTTGNLTYGKDEDGNVVGQFLQTHELDAVTVNITDLYGEAIQGLTVVDLHWVYGNNPKDYGGYTDSDDIVDVPLKLFASTTDGKAFTLTNQMLVDQTNANTAFEGKAKPILQRAGTYKATLVYTVNGKSYSSTGKVYDEKTAVADLNYAVYSAAPTVEITAISNPTGTFSADTNTSGKIEDTLKTESQGSGLKKQYRAYWTINSSHITGCYNSIASAKATVHFVCDHGNTSPYGYTGWYSVLALGGEAAAQLAAINDRDYHHYTQPTVTITLSGYGNASGATLSFAPATEGATVHLYTGSGTTGATTGYSWTADGDAVRYVGSHTKGGDSRDDTKVAAGTLTATQLVLTDSNGTQYYVSTNITIQNPY